VLTGYLSRYISIILCHTLKLIQDLRQFKLPQHTRVQYAKHTNRVILASKIDLDRSSMALQERRICHTNTLAQTHAHSPTMSSLTINLLNPVPLHLLILQPILPCQERAPEHQHQPIQQAVHLLEPTRLAHYRRRKVPLIPALALLLHVDEANVAHLEDLHRHGVVLVRVDRLEQAGKQTRAHELVLCGFGVRELDGGFAVIFAV
jgi:hypothetical protein